MPGHPRVGTEGGGVCSRSGDSCMGHARERSSTVRLSGAYKLECQGEGREINWWLMREGAPSHSSGQHSRGSAACWVLTVLSFGLFERSHYHTCPWRLGTKDAC